MLDTHFNEATAVATARVELPDMSILRIGTLVRDDQGSAWVVIAILEDHAIAIKNVLISNPPEWEIVGEQKVIDASEENFIRLAKPFGWHIVSRAVE